MSSSSKDGLAEAERRIAEAKRAGEIVLNLSDLGLEALPESGFSPCALAVSLHQQQPTRRTAGEYRPARVLTRAYPRKQRMNAR